MTRGLHIFADFDGTITLTDSLQHLLAVFAGEGWRDIESLAEADVLLESAALQMEFDLVRATEEEAFEVIKGAIAVDTSFPRFVRWCNREGASLTVVSGGFEPIILRLLKRAGMEGIDVRANNVRIENRRWTVVPAERRRICARCNHCKSAHLLRSARRGSRIIYIGNGMTDRCPAAHADILFAKGALADHCRRCGVRFHHFDDFDEVRELIERELKIAEKRSASKTPERFGT